MGKHHGHAAPGRESRTWRSWFSMRQRCNNTKHPQYPNYGGRGIQVCGRWEEFIPFLDDMGERPENTSLDRIDNNGGYELGNCRWASAVVQANNTRNKPRKVDLPRGVKISRDKKKFDAEIRIDGKKKYLGAFVTAAEASAAYEAARAEKLRNVIP